MTDRCATVLALLLLGATPALAQTTPAPAPVTPMPPASTAAVPPVASKPVTPPPPAVAQPAKPAPAAAATPVFPDKVDAKYASLKPGAARRKTCDDQFKANKATGGNAGLKWIAKGGYYSQCSKHLKALPAG